MTYGLPITNDQAKSVAAAVCVEARKNGWAVTIAIVDTSGELVYFEKLDGALFGAIDTAIAKARSAARFQQSTKELQELVGAGGGGLRVLGMAGAVPIAGGEPLLIDGKVVGAIGVSGIPAALDGQLAVVGAKALR